MNTPEGGQKAAATLQLRFGADYWETTGRRGKGVKKSKPAGLAYLKLHDPEKFAAVRQKALEQRRLNKEARDE